jgi:hypothetical protein
MDAPSPDLSNLWLARAFNAQDVEAAAALYHPDAAIVQVDQVHGGTTIARGAEAIPSAPIPTGRSNDRRIRIESAPRKEPIHSQRHKKLRLCGLDVLRDGESDSVPIGLPASPTRTAANSNFIKPARGLRSFPLNRDPADGLVTDPLNSLPAPSESEHPAVPSALVRPSSRLP